MKKIHNINKINLNERIIWIDDDIDEYSLEYSKWILEWNRQDAAEEKTNPEFKRTPIRLLFFCYGGDLNVNNMLVDTIMLSKTPIIGINMGQADSAGCFIYLACHQRYTFPNAKFLIHKGSGTFTGTYEVVVSALDMYQREIESLGNYILSRTKIPKKMFEEYFNLDWYLTADEAVKYGLASKKINSLDDIFSDTPKEEPVSIVKKIMKKTTKKKATAKEEVEE